MGNSTPQPRFPSEIWDGTTPSTPSVQYDKAADPEFMARHRAEILALEQTLNEYLSLLEKIKNYGVGNSILGVKNDGTELEYKVLVEGSGVTITHGSGTITISASAVPDTQSAVADEGVAFGQPLRMKADGHVELAQADTETTSFVAGLATGTVNTGETVSYVSKSIVQSDWTAVTGTVTLTPGATYFLGSTTAGVLTTTAPTTPGDYVVRVGRALNITTLDLEIDWPIYL